MLQPFERRMPGSVRGQLVGLNVSRGNRASLRLPNRRIVRVGFETTLRGELKEALYQEVELRGLVKRWADLFGIDPEFTGDLSTTEHLEANRGEA